MPGSSRPQLEPGPSSLRGAGGGETSVSEQTAVEAPVRGRSRSTVRSKLHRIDSRTAPYLYISPFFVLFAAFGLFPLGYTAWVAMTDRTLLDPTWSFIGLQNFTA